MSRYAEPKRLPVNQPAEIARCVIHPGLGVARVGNATDDFFIGPEAPGEVPNPDGGFKDAAVRVKRQAARFRVYGLDGAGRVVREITADDGEVSWRVHLANRKADWYQFINAMDLGPDARPARRRNEAIRGADRAALVIDPGPRSIAGRGAGVPYSGSRRFAPRSTAVG